MPVLSKLYYVATTNSFPLELSVDGTEISALLSTAARLPLIAPQLQSQLMSITDKL